MNKNLIGIEFIRKSNENAKKLLDKIVHCFNQLDDDDIWWRPNENMNSIGNLMLHLSGNLRQWIITGVSGAEDMRNRPAEFEEKGSISKDELLDKLVKTVNEIAEIFSTMNPEILLEQRRIQGSDIKLLDAIYSSLSHFEGHVGQILYITRMRLGEKYIIYWQPENEEQGA